MKQSIKIIMSGGGTGGHIYPAVSIANALKELNTDIDILFIGANGRMEMDKVPAAGYNIRGIDIIGLQRRFNWKNFLLPFYVFKSIHQVKKIFKEFQPNAVIGTGGYVSFPVLFTAQMMSIPTYIQEQNAYAGLANKLLTSKARKIFVAFENLEKYFPKEKIMITGNPVRNDLTHLSSLRSNALLHFHLDINKPIVLILGGSLGAKTINQTIAQHLDFFIKNNVQLIWQMGKNFYQQLSEELKNKLNHPTIYYKDFIFEMHLAYAAADIIISRAGASTIAELAIVGKPAVLIPSPNVTDDHQTKNAKALSEKNAAILIQDSEVKEKLIPQIENLLTNHVLKQQLTQNIQQFAKPNAAEEIARYILNDIQKNEK
ncbi:MAG: undecaprenyldiphospho-muramoylpentapeptide beta-N-acetylglucosaminyltransferase [Bacteroidia bacterium]|nr:undecaprenyldiphospho-muramoylpentapeptide beta-N-acetylglucosaminyltransferase [Bacteroidia bacterium]